MKTVKKKLVLNPTVVTSLNETQLTEINGGTWTNIITGIAGNAAYEGIKYAAKWLYDNSASCNAGCTTGS